MALDPRAKMLPDEEELELIHKHIHPHLEHAIISLEGDPDLWHAERKSASDSLVSDYFPRLKEGCANNTLKTIPTSDMEIFMGKLYLVLFNEKTSKPPVRFEWTNAIESFGQTVFKERPVLVQIDTRWNKTMVDLICTIIHEACHAFTRECFWYFGCWNADARSVELFSKIDGKTAHGYLWQSMTLAIEQHVLRYNKVVLDIGRLDGAKEEIEESGVLPEEEYLQALFKGEHFDEMCKFVEEVRLRLTATTLIKSE